MAPFLSFTAEEAWKLVGTTQSIYTETYAALAAPDEALLAKWSRIRAVRNFVNQNIETLRADGKVGSSLQAEVRIAAPHQQYRPVGVTTGWGSNSETDWQGDDYATLASLKEDLKYVFITSKVELVEDIDGYGRIDISASANTKCERCWHYVADIGANPTHPTICGRCDSNLHGAGEVRNFA
jgi:isoleucyl-tRNA synthetase